MSSSIPSVSAKPLRKDGREVEWQLACTDLGSVSRWLREHGTIDGLTLEPRSTLQIFDTYLDTDDWRIHRAGFALRVRSESGTTEATLKSLHSASTEVADRREITETLNGSDSDAIRELVGPVGARVSAVSGARALLPLFELRTSRQRFAVRKCDEPGPLGEIALDETVISRPHGEPQASMLRVEVEALTEVYGPLRSLVKTLRSNCALEAASDTKYSLGLRSVGLAPPAQEPAASTADSAMTVDAAVTVDPAVTVDASMTVVEVALVNLRRYLAAWFLHEPGARLGEDPEELHDLRVAGRRLDAVLRQFRSFLPPQFRKVRRTLKAVLSALGRARDLDVALIELQDFSRKLPKAHRVGVEPLKEHLMSERARARAQMLSVLDSIWVRRNLHELTVLLAAPVAASEASEADLALRASPGLIRRRFRKLRKRADHMGADSSTEEYHEVRGQVKKLRYALEAVAELYGKPANDMVRALRRWQENLGLQQDAAVATQRLNALAGAKPTGIPAETLFLMGRLAERHLGAAAQARKRCATGYRKVRQKWKRLRLKFEKSTANQLQTP